MKDIYTNTTSPPWITTPPPTPSSSLSLQLPRDVFHNLIHTLTAALPAPIPDTPEARAIRDNAAIARVASQLPANAEEADLASLGVLATAHAHECLRRAGEYNPETPLHQKFSNRADSMMRQARGFRSLLLRVQAIRQKREANPAAREQAAWIEHSATGLMADALGRPRSVPIFEPTAPAPAAQPQPERDPDDKFAAMTEAEQYATLYPKRAAQIRVHRGLPPRCSFGPPEQELIDAILASTSPVLLALDAQAAAD